MRVSTDLNEHFLATLPFVTVLLKLSCLIVVPFWSRTHKILLFMELFVENKCDTFLKYLQNIDKGHRARSIRRFLRVSTILVLYKN